MTTDSSSRPNVNGNREQANDFMLDGLDNNQVSDNLVGYAPLNPFTGGLNPEDWYYTK